MEQIAIHKFSTGIRRAKQRYTILQIMVPVIFVAFLFLSPISRHESLATKAGIGLVVFILWEMIFYVTSSIALRKLSELSVSIFPDRFERESRKQKEIFLWKDVRRTEILEYPNGEIASIKLTLTNKKAVNLFGFENMELASKQIEQAIPNEVSVNRKRMRINWDEPVIMILTGLLTLVIILAVQELGERAYRFFNVLFFFSFGLYNLVFRPISRAQGKGWKIFETVIGGILIITSVSILVLELSLK